MPQYMVHFGYTPQAWAALIKSPVDRTEALAAAGKKVGCKLLSLHYTMGEYDGVAMVEAPDDTSIMAFSLAATSAGHLRAGTTTRLYTPAEAVAALTKARSADFQAPR